MESAEEEDDHQGVKSSRGPCYEQQEPGTVNTEGYNDPGIKELFPVVQSIHKQRNRNKRQDTHNKSECKKRTVINKVIEYIEKVNLDYFELVYEIFLTLKRRPGFKLYL
jgi:hypothetical protein